MTVPRTPATGRGVELGLLAFAAGLVTLALVLVQTSQNQPLSRLLVYLGLAYLALFGVAHAAVRRWAVYAALLLGEEEASATVDCAQIRWRARARRTQS